MQPCGDTVNYIFHCTVKYKREFWSFLPRKGYKCLTVTDKIHEEIKKRAKETKHNMREYVEYLLAKEKDAKEGK